MPDQFADVLDRMEVDFENVGPDWDVMELLTGLLRIKPSGLQLQIAQDKLRAERRAFLLEGLAVGVILRQGRAVTVLRDVRGRFLATGAARVQAYIAAL